jgi:glycosyltransferase involved in cell wall biosynthesis
MTRVGIVSEYYDPEGGSAVVPGFIARALLKRGMQVEVLTGFPNYPAGKIYPGYEQKFHVREVMNGIVVHRVPLYPNHSMKASQRIASYASFAASSTFGMHYLRNCDAILVHSTPVTAGIGPAINQVFRGRPLVTMIQDLWPETLLHSGFTKRSKSWKVAQSLAQTVSDAIYRRSDALAVISPGMISALTDRGIPQEKIHLVHNWVPEEILTPDDPLVGAVNLRKSKDRLLVLYAGNLGEPQAVRTIIDAAVLLRNRRDIEFVLVGSGVLEGELKEVAAWESLDQVRFLGARPIGEIAALVEQADIQLVTLAPSPIFEMTIPSKLQFSLGFGKAIVAAFSGDPATIARESGAAIVCSPGSSTELASAISQAAEMPRTQLESMGRSGKSYFNQHFTERVGGDTLADLLLTVIARKKHEK